MLGFAGEIIAVDGKTYVKTTHHRPAVPGVGRRAPAGRSVGAGGMIDNLGDILLKEGVELAKGDDVACGSKQCYTVSANLTSEELGTARDRVAGNLPVDLTGASLALTVRVEKDLPNHLAGVEAVVTMGDGIEAHRRRDGLEMGRARDDHRAARRPGQARLVGPPPGRRSTTAG